MIDPEWAKNLNETIKRAIVVTGKKPAKKAIGPQGQEKPSDKD